MLHKLLSIALLTTTTIVCAQENHITFVNHFNNELHFKIGINPNVLPDFPKEFSLKYGDSLNSKILDMHKEAYIRAEDEQKHSAFFGIEIVNHQTKVHGYVDKGIAFSWNTDTIIFCTPEEYHKHHSCF